LQAIFEQPKTQERTTTLKKISRDFGAASGIFGIGMMGIVSVIPAIAHLFTKDPSVVSMVISIVPWLMANFAVHGFVCAGEGILLGQKDLSFLGRAFTGFFAVVPIIMLQTRKWFGKNLALIDLWKVFVAYNVTRCFLWIGRILLLERRSVRELEAISNVPERNSFQEEIEHLSSSSAFQ